MQSCIKKKKKKSIQNWYSLKRKKIAITNLCSIQSFIKNNNLVDF